jgi:mRNA interferase HigB
MNIVSHKRLFDFYQKHKKAELPLEYWFKTVKSAKWKCFADIKKDFNRIWKE